MLEILALVIESRHQSRHLPLAHGCSGTGQWGEAITEFRCYEKVILGKVLCPSESLSKISCMTKERYEPFCLSDRIMGKNVLCLGQLMKVSELGTR